MENQNTPQRQAADLRTMLESEPPKKASSRRNSRGTTLSDIDTMSYDELVAYISDSNSDFSDDNSPFRDESLSGVDQPEAPSRRRSSSVSSFKSDEESELEEAERAKRAVPYSFGPFSKQKSVAALLSSSSRPSPSFDPSIWDSPSADSDSQKEKLNIDPFSYDDPDDDLNDSSKVASDIVNNNGVDHEGYDHNGFDSEGYDRNGFDSEGYDRNGFDGEGYDRNGFDGEGYDRNGFDGEGYDRNGFDGEGYDRNGFDGEGYDRNGFDGEGYDRNGFDGEGYDREGYDCDNYDREGYDWEGYDWEGFDRDGFDREGYDREGYDRDNYDREGYDWEGYDWEGYSRDGCDREGHKRENSTDKDLPPNELSDKEYDNDEIDREGYDSEGFDSEGFDSEGFDSEGFDREGFDREGFDREGFDREGFDRDNYDREGYDWEGYDWEGYDYGGFDREGYDKEGYTRQDWEAAGYAFGPRGEFIMPESEDSSVLDQEELSEETIEELPLPDQAVPVHNDYANNLSNNEENEEGPTDNTGNELATKGRTERSSNSIEPDSVQLEPSDKTAYTEEESDGQLVHGLNSEQPEEGKPLTHNMKEAHQQTQGAEAQDKHKNKDYPQLEEPHEEEAYEEEDYHQDREEELQDEYQDEDYPQLEEPHEEEAYEEEDYHQDREEALQDEYQDEDYPQLEEPHEEEAYEEEDYHQNREEALQDEYQNKDYPQLEEPHEEEAHDEEDYHQNREEALQDEYQDEDYPQLEEPHEEEAYEEEDYHQAAVNPQSVDHDDILSYVAPQPSRTVPDSSPYVRSDIPVYDPQNSRFGSMTRPWSYECDYAIDYESGSRRGQRISLLVSEMGNERTLTIGSPGERVNDIEVDEPSIANDQALLRYSGGRFTLINFQEEDIKLNKRLVTCGEQVNLLTGDEITLGSTTLVFRERTTSEILEGYSIDVVEGTETDLGKSFPLLRQRSTIGRDRNSDIPLTDQEISRNHCTLAFRGGKFFLQHRSDTNPTFINGVSVPSGGERQITVSDKIKISSRTVLQLIKHT